MKSTLFNFAPKTPKRRSRLSWKSASPTSPGLSDRRPPHRSEPGIPPARDHGDGSMTMDRPINVCVLVGSLRKASFNRMLANALIGLAPSSMKLDIVDIG